VKNGTAEATPERKEGDADNTSRLEDLKRAYRKVQREGRGRCAKKGSFCRDNIQREAREPEGSNCKNGKAKITPRNVGSVRRASWEGEVEHNPKREKELVKKEPKVTLGVQRLGSGTPTY